MAPAVNGVTHGQQAHRRCKGANVSFRILGGDYRITVQGEGISVSARGSGAATLLGVPACSSRDTGIYSTRSRGRLPGRADQCEAIPTTLTRVPFGKTDAESHP